MHRYILLALLVLASGCTQKISDIKSDDFVGRQVTVAGTVENTLKIGSLSGFMLVDDDSNSIAVSSKALPEEGERALVTGVVIKDTIFGYYIKAEKVR